MAKPTTTDRLSAARAELDAINRQRAELAGKRNAALLADDDRIAVKLASQIDDLRSLARGHEDKIKLLEDEAARELAERQVKEKAALIGRIEKKLAERDRAGAELAAAVKIMDDAFRKLIALGRDITAAWPLGPHDPAACILSPGAITRALQHEIFRVGSRPHLLGGQDKPDNLVHLPGGMSPAINLINSPDRVMPLIEVLAQATRHASATMHTGKAAAVVTNGAQVEHRQLSATESRLAGLHRRLAELGALPSPTPDEDREYTAVVAEVAKITSAIEAEKAGAQS
jgi:hypothetical protein